MLGSVRWRVGGGGGERSGEGVQRVKKERRGMKRASGWIECIV